MYVKSYRYLPSSDKLDEEVETTSFHRNDSDLFFYGAYDWGAPCRAYSCLPLPLSEAASSSIPVSAEVYFYFCSEVFICFSNYFPAECNTVIGRIYTYIF